MVHRRIQEGKIITFREAFSQGVDAHVNDPVPVLCSLSQSHVRHIASPYTGSLRLDFARSALMRIAAFASMSLPIRFSLPKRWRRASRLAHLVTRTSKSRSAPTSRVCVATMNTGALSLPSSILIRNQIYVVDQKSYHPCRLAACDRSAVSHSRRAWPRGYDGPPARWRHN